MGRTLAGLDGLVGLGEAADIRGGSHGHACTGDLRADASMARPGRAHQGDSRPCAVAASVHRARPAPGPADSQEDRPGPEKGTAVETDRQTRSGARDTRSSSCTTPREQVISPLGMHACFDPPSSRAGSVTAQRLMEGIEEKVRKYKGLAAQYAVPLIVAVGAHRFTGVTLEHLDDAANRAACPQDHLPVQRRRFAHRHADGQPGARTSLAMAERPSRAALDPEPNPLQPHGTPQPDSPAADARGAGAAGAA